MEKQKKQVAEQAEDDMIDPRYSPIVVFTGGPGSPTNSVGLDKNIIALKGDEFNKIKVNGKLNIIKSVNRAPYKLLSNDIEYN